jgi:arylsulfatase A-like enzyme
MSHGSEAAAVRQPPAAIPLSRWVALAAIVATVCGLTEALIQFIVMREVLHRPILGGGELIWMIPLGLFIILLPFAAGAAAIDRGSTNRRRSVAAALVLLPALFSLLSLQPNLHRGAVLLIAAGLALRLAGPIGRWIGGPSGPIRRTTLGAVVGSVVLGLGWWGVTAGLEAKRAAALPPAPRTVPNVILLVWDTVREANLSLSGYQRPTTPNLELLANQGTTFDLALATAPWTLPSHASMFSGRWEHEMFLGHRLPVEFASPPLAELLADQGYLTGAFVGNATTAGREYGLDRGFLHHDSYPIDFRTIPLAPSLGRQFFREGGAVGLSGGLTPRLGFRRHPWRKPAGTLNRRFLGWIDRRQAGRPFFAFLNYNDAHAPYWVPRPFDRAFGADPKRPWTNLNKSSRAAASAAHLAAVDGEIRAYDAAIGYVDASLAELVKGLADRGILDNTVLIVTADHGELFGEHGLFYHSNSLHRQLLQVPLVIKGPGVPPGLRISGPVSLRSVPATIWDLLGLDGAPIPGPSLRSSWERPDSTSTTLVFSGETLGSGAAATLRGANAIITGDRYYLAWPGIPPELYRLREDPRQEVNIIANPEEAERVARFQQIADSIDRVRRATRSRE